MLGFEFELDAGPPGSCAVHVGAGALDVLVQRVAADPPGSPIALISDSNVAPLHGRSLRERLARHVETHLLSFPAGEAHKTRESKTRLEDEMWRVGCGRDSAVVALGGGVTGDLAGFVASTWHRGVPVIQAPTSMLAMVDACLGGKTGVDLPGGKNLVGSFHQPRAIYADLTTLVTLPDTELVHGLAEVIKTAAIADAVLCEVLERSTAQLLDRHASTLEQVVGRCLRVKSEVVVRDPRESGARAMLNFGHTVGHALETVTRYGLPHGRAVSIGMLVEAELARATTGFPAADCRRLEALLDSVGLPVQLPAGVDCEALIAATRRDKKARAGTARYALPARLGSMPPGDVCRVVDEAALRDALASRTPRPR